MDKQDIGEVQVEFGNDVATAVEEYFDSTEFIDQKDDGGAFDELVFEYSHRYVDRIWELQAEFESHDIVDAAEQIIRELESTTRVSPTVPVYVAEMLVDLAGGQRQVGAYLTRVVHDLWVARALAARAEAKPEASVQAGGLLERIEANQRRMIELLSE